MALVGVRLSLLYYGLVGTSRQKKGVAAVLCASATAHLFTFPVFASPNSFPENAVLPNKHKGYT